MTKYDYWKESLSESLDALGVKLTDEQLNSLADDVLGSQECMSQYYGEDVQHRGGREISKEDYDRLGKKVKELERERDAYRDFIGKDRNVSDNCIEVDRNGVNIYRRYNIGYQG